MKRLLAVVVSLVVLFALVFGTIELVRMANGDFAGDYKVSGTFPSAGEGLHPGSAVVFRGVQVGRVSTITLYQNQAQVTLLIEPTFKVPATSTATIQPVNLFGAEQVSISSPHANSDAGPYLAPGASFAHATSSDELGDLFAAATPLLKQINTNQLSTVLSELAQASAGEGRKIAAGIDAGTQLAGLLDRTLNAQILALDSFAKFTQAIAPAAGDLNNLNTQINAGLPAFNAEEADYQNLINTLIPFSNRLATLLATYHPDIATILTSGDNVSRVLLAQQDYDRPGHQRRLSLLPEDRAGRVRTEQVARRQHLRLLQHLHPLHRRQQPRLQPHCAAHGRDVLPRAAAAGARGGRLGLQLLVGAVHLQRAAVQRRRVHTGRCTVGSDVAHLGGQQCGLGRGEPGLRDHRPARHLQAHHARRDPQPAARGFEVRFWRHFPASAFKFALFALVCIVLLVGLAVKIGNITLFGSQHTVNAELSDVTGLAGGDTVNIAGVQVGQVKSIGVQHGHAVISMSINNTVTLRQSTDVGMRWHNVIGQKEIELYPGKSGAVLASGSTIPMNHDVTDASIDKFLNSIGPVLASINPTEANAFVENVSGALEGDTAQINQLINSGAAVSTTVQALDTQVGSIIGNLDQVLTALASRSGDIDSLVSNLQTVSSALASKNTLLDGVVGNLSKVATDLASLIGNNHTTITNTINNLQAVAADVQTNQQNLSSSLGTLGAGLAPYIQISQWGQWFAVETIYTCLAGQTVCPYYQPSNPPPGSGPFGSPPLPAPLQNVTTPGLPNPNAPATSKGGGATSSSSTSAGSLAASSLEQDLQAVSGAGTTTPTTSGGSK